MNGIDYEALAKAASDVAKRTDESTWHDVARAIIAALADQGMVVAKRDDLRIVWGELLEALDDEDDGWRAQAHPSFLAVLARIGALTTPKGMTDGR